ncbi:unnamed protein product, partial [Rotaria sp. Silwood1]
CPRQGVLRPSPARGEGRRHGVEGLVGSHRAGIDPSWSVPGQPARCNHGRPGAAACRAGHLHRHAPERHVRQPHEPRRPGDRVGHARGRSRRGRRERRATPWTRQDRGQAATLARGPARGQGSRDTRGGRRPHHRGRVLAAADPAGPGRQVLRTGRDDHRLCAGGVACAVVDRHPGGCVVLDQAGRVRLGRCDVGRGGPRLHTGRQDVLADDGRGRSHRWHREAAVGQPGGDRSAGSEDPPGVDEKHPGNHRRGGAGRLRRNRVGPHGAEPDGYLPRAQAARGVAAREQGRADCEGADGAGSDARYQVQLHPAHRHARVRDDHRRAR